MATGRGLGPVFAYEWLTTSRRWQVYAGRALFVGLLLLALTVVWAAHVAGRTFGSIQEMANVGQQFFGAIVVSELTLVLLTAPAATAGAICQEKARGNLSLLLLTSLSETEIVLGKLASRLVPVVGLVGCTLPVLALGTMLGGIDPEALAWSFAITLAVAVLSCTIALTFSLWGTKPHEVLLATFAVQTIWLLSVPVWEFFTWIRGLPRVPRWALASNPYILALAPYARPGGVDAVDFVGFVGGSLAVAAALLVVSIRRLRAVVIAQADGTAESRGRREWWPGSGRWWGGRSPSLEGNPVLWYEAHRKRPSAWMRGLMRLYAGLAVGFSVLAIEDIVAERPGYLGILPGYVNAFQVVMGIPLLLLSATTALVEERSRGSLDVLLTTPLDSSSIVLAKWWSVFRHAPPLLLLPMLVNLVIGWKIANWLELLVIILYLLSVCAAWTSIGLALSTWIPKLGRAVAVAVSLFALVGLGWPMMVLTLWRDGTPNGQRISLGPGLSMVSPFYGVFYQTEALANWGRDQSRLWRWTGGWTEASGAVAVVLLLAVLASFDGCLGRIPAARSRRGRPQSDADEASGSW